MRRFAFGNTAGAYLIALAASSAVCGPVSAANVVLKDGTVIHGEVESLQDGIYTIRTDSLGAVRVPSAQVRTIDEGDGSTKPSAPASSSESPQGAALNGIQSELLGDPKLLQMLLALQDDPDVVAVLADPKIMKEMAAGDYTSLMNDPKIVALMNNAKVRALMDALQ